MKLSSLLVKVKEPGRSPAGDPLDLEGTFHRTYFFAAVVELGGLRASRANVVCSVDCFPDLGFAEGLRAVLGAVPVAAEPIEASQRRRSQWLGVWRTGREPGAPGRLRTRHPGLVDL